MFQCRNKKKYCLVWNDTEINVLLTLFHHYGEDYQHIAEQMDIIFLPKHYIACNCRNMLISNGPSNLFDRSPLKHSEINFIHKQFKDMINSGSKYLCKRNLQVLGQDIALYFPQRDLFFIRHNYFQLLKQVVKSMCYQYISDLRYRNFYFQRLRKMSQKSWLIILYLSQLDLNQVYPKEQIVQKMWESSNTIEKFISIFINQRQYALDDFTNQPRLLDTNNQPYFTSQKLMEILEPILVIDTLARICSSHAPYNFEGHNLKRHNQKTHNFTIDDDEVVVPERQVEIFWGIIMKQRIDKNLIKYKLKQYTYDYLYMNMSKSQMKLIINSDVMKFLLPISFSVDQILGKEQQRVILLQ